MRIKLLITTLFAIALPAAMLARTTSEQGDCDRIRSDDATGPVIKLDLKGSRGVVFFRHRHHEAYLNPDNEFAHQARPGAECIGCHHKRSESTGVPVLAKCGACHGGEGDPRNPRNSEGDEVWSKRAFHDLCIGCHRASNEKKLAKCEKAPVACNECHGAKS